jgi:exodeoxyribonuclease VII small subunit
VRKQRDQSGEGATAGKTARGKAPQSFEQAIERLERIVQQLESGEESLDESLGLYEEAIRLSRFCEERLRAADERIEKLTGASEAEAEAEENEE